MNLTDDQRCRALLGLPVLYKDLFIIYPAKMEEICKIGFEKFFGYLNFIGLYKPRDIKDPTIKLFLEDKTDFDFFFFNCIQDEAKAIEALSFFLGETDILFLQETEQIVVGNITERRIIDEKNFFGLQSAIQLLHWQTPSSAEFLPSDDERLRSMKEKIRLGEEKARKQKAKAITGPQMELSDLISSLRIALPALDISQMTYYAFRDALIRLGYQEAYDINNRAALAGAKIDKNKLKHWMRPMDYD